MIHRNLTAMDSRFSLTSASPNTTSSLFHFHDYAIRTDVDPQGNPWFVASDVCAALEIKNSRQALAKLDSDEKGVISSDTLGGIQSIATVNEAGLYELIFRSRKPEAKNFKRWVKHTVLPTIRKDGLYVLGEEKLFAECATDAELEEAFAKAQARVAELFNEKASRQMARHIEEREARSLFYKTMNRGRVRRRKGPKQLSK